MSKIGASSLRRTLFLCHERLLGQNAPLDEPPVYQFMDRKRAEGRSLTAST